MQHRHFLVTLTLLALVSVLVCIVPPSQPAMAIPAPLLLPFSVGETWYVCQGYNGTVSHPNAPALDLSIDPGSPGSQGCTPSTSNSSTGKVIIAPGAGNVYQGTGQTGGPDAIYINFDAGGSVLLAHMIHKWVPGSLNTFLGYVTAGEAIGTVLAPSAANGYYAHIHMMIFSGSSINNGSALPFEDAHQTRFQCAPDMPYSGEVNQYSGTALSRCDINPSYRVEIDQPINNGVILNDSSSIGGWAIYQPTLNGTGITDVHIWLDAPAPNGQFLGGAQYGLERSDVAGIYGEQYRYSGFELTWDTHAVPAGPHTLYIAARRPDGSWSADQVRSFTVQHPTRVSVERPAENTTIQEDTYPIRGWALHQTTSPNTGVTDVHIWLDAPSPPNGQFLGGARYGIERPDIASLYGEKYRYSGFELTWDTHTVTPGVHTLYIAARHPDASWSANQIRTVTVQHPTRLIVELPADNITLPQDTTTIQGWALHQTTSSNTGVTDVHIWLDAPSPPNGQFLGGARYGIERPDIASLYGEKYRYSGFELTWDTHTVTPGVHTLYIAARHPDASWSANQIRTVTVQPPITPRRYAIWLPMLRR